MLQEYFPEELIPEETTYDNLRYMKNDLGNEKIDLTKYLLSAGTLKNADGQFFTYHLTGMTIERMLAADETQTVYDLMPSENKPSALRIKIRYAETDGSLFDMMTYLYGASTTISFADIAESYRLLPRAGVIVIFCAGKPKGDYNPDDPESNVDNIIREYTMHFIPNESGQTTIDREDLKVTFTYEKTGDPAVDIHYNIGRALDYYKEVHGRNGYDGNNAPVYNIVYQPTTDDIMTLMPPQTNEMLAIEGKPNDDISDPREMPLYIFEMSNFNAGVINTYKEGSYSITIIAKDRFGGHQRGFLRRHGHQHDEVACLWKWLRITMGSRRKPLHQILLRTQLGKPQVRHGRQESQPRHLRGRILD